MIVAPYKFDFITSFLNIIDLLGILPFFVSVGLNLISSTYSLEYIAKAAQIFRILRILRIFKLSRHITGLKTLGTTLRNSHRSDWKIKYYEPCDLYLTKQLEETFHFAEF